MRFPMLAYGQANWPMHTSVATLHRQSQHIPWRDWLKVTNKLRAAGMSKVAVLQPAAQLASLELRPDEHIKAIARGNGHAGQVTLFATNQRLLVMNQNHDEISTRSFIYPFIDGAWYSTGFRNTHVTLFTGFGDYRIRNVDPKQAMHFVHYIQSRCEPSHNTKEAWYDHHPQKRPV